MRRKPTDPVWSNDGQPETSTSQSQSDTDLHGKPKTEHIEDAESSRYRPAPEITPDSALPLITKAEVIQSAKPGSKAAWIVIDGVVFDCTDFISEHPGGQDVIESFRGEDCSWQFWRFHQRRQMEEFGKALRIGRTEGMVNKYKEPPRYVGLRTVSSMMDDW
jgi:cytochrome b involved in lipid metabolism